MKIGSIFAAHVGSKSLFIQERKMTDNQIAKYIELTIKDCVAARANPTYALTHIDAIHSRMKHVLDTMKKEREDVTGAPV